MITEEMLMMYLKECRERNRLDWKTIKAYECDLRQFYHFMAQNTLCKKLLEDYVATLHQLYSPRSVQRKLASLNAFFQYLVFYDFLKENPLHKIRITFRKPQLLPRTIPLAQIQQFFHYLYEQRSIAKTPYQKKYTTRNIAIFELLFSTGLRISELCHIRLKDLDLRDFTLRVYGKGRKERILSIGSESTQKAILAYYQMEHLYSSLDTNLFLNRFAKPLSDQSVRMLIHQYCEQNPKKSYMTPHMFRHTFASLLLEEEVDIRYIQHILGHSSISTTQIYTHVSNHKQKEILRTKNPRDLIQIER